MKIALAGFGQEGRASFEYWNRDGNVLTVVDERETADVPNGTETITGSDAFSKLADFDLIIRSPGINPRKLPYGDKVWSATNEFFEKCPAPIIGVTGTKGKGTTSSLITSVLRAAGKTVHLVGNIGTPALLELSSIASTDLVVFELSSFQLWDIKRSPHVAVILGIEADHLDVHDDFEDYVNAKANIARYQTDADRVIFNKNNDIAARIVEAALSDKVAYPDQSIMDTYAPSLVIPGRHNVENAAAAVAATQEYVTDFAVISAGLAAFTGLPHRIKFIREAAGVLYYDDSYSSAPAASIAALKSFDAPRIIILGGYDKHANFDELARYVANTENVKAVLIGQTKDRIAAVFRSVGIDEARYEALNTTNFSEIVSHVASMARNGDVVLLSPGSASFDMFKNFTDRGEQFTKLVTEL